MPQAQPYLCKHLGAVLVACGHKNASKDTRVAADAAVKAINDAISPNSVRELVPALLEAADGHTSKWQSRVAALLALASFADHAPEQLGAALPDIVPEVSKSIVDIKKEVADAAEKAMLAACEVIGNRDIEHMTTHIVRSVTHPEETPEIMHKLAGVTFVQSVESPALAMVTPLLVRGLQSGVTCTTLLFCKRCSRTF
jgi:elongation factor 3